MVYLGDGDRLAAAWTTTLLRSLGKLPARTEMASMNPQRRRNWLNIISMKLLDVKRLAILAVLLVSLTPIAFPAAVAHNNYEEISYEVLEEALTYPIPGLWGGLAGGILDWYFGIPMVGGSAVTVEFNKIWTSTMYGYFRTGESVPMRISVWTGDEVGSYSIDIKVTRNSSWGESLLVLHIYDVPGGLQIDLGSAFIFQERGDYTIQVSFHGASWWSSSSDSLTVHVI